MTADGHSGTYLGVDLGATNVRAGVVRDGKLDVVRSAGIDANGSVDAVMAQIFALIDTVWADDVDALGVGVPSVVDVEQGIVYDVQNIPSMAVVPVRALLEERYQRPALVNNDVNCFVLGEHAFGKAQPYRHVAGLNLGTGFAAGLIVDGMLYEGSNCGAGEFGMVPYQDSILENFCSGLFFIRRGVDAGDMHRKATAGDEAAQVLWNEFGRHVGQAMKVVLYTVDPEIIILGGSIRKAYDLFRTSMWSAMQDFAFRPTLENLKFELSELDHAALLGAASLPCTRG